MAASGASQTVGLDAVARRQRFPFALDPSVLFQAVERGKQRSGLDLERPARRLKDALGDSGAMERLQFERPENQQVQSALDERGDGLWIGLLYRCSIPQPCRPCPGGLDSGAGRQDMKASANARPDGCSAVVASRVPTSSIRSERGEVPQLLGIPHDIDRFHHITLDLEGAGLHEPVWPAHNQPR